MPRHDLDVPASDVLPLAVGTFDGLGPLSRADFPHRHSFYELVHVTHGCGAHVIDLDAYPIRPPQFFVITPGQVHHWRDAHDLRGQLVLCTPDLLADNPTDRDALHRTGHRCWRPTDPAQAARIATLLAAMTDEYRRQQPGCRSVLRAYLHILLTELLRATPDSAPPDPVPHHPQARALAVARRFDELLAEPALLGEPAHSYARRIGVSVRHLNELVPRATGTTPARLIRQARVLEAKRLLTRTDLTVARIAARLGFTDPAYFCRFFRREVGQSPGEFRHRLHPGPDGTADPPESTTAPPTNTSTPDDDSPYRRDDRRSARPDRHRTPAPEENP
ncbi:helix-turn-helix domain-containing protein [Micromonospora echinofusca]|uniref:Helix-turn-helix domain-containing protein n=1 Tax=Micromonospora echinofusca TaxID=47858 RepID=A0ABS3VXP1_MICEH|nr:helix-turn-helix domain-containing protein [Micromonospora echinofusca]